MRIKKAAKILPLFFAPPPRINFLLQLRQFHLERKPFKKKLFNRAKRFPLLSRNQMRKSNKPSGREKRKK